MSHISTHGMEHDKNMLSLLKRTHARISQELQIIEKHHNQIQNAIRVPEDIVHKLEGLDKFKVELPKLRAGNARMNVILIALSGKINVIEEELIDLRKTREAIQTELSEKLAKKNKAAKLRSRIMPKAKLTELKAKLDKDFAGLKQVADELNRLKTEMPRLMEKRDELKEELGLTIKKISSTQEQIIILRPRLERLAPKVSPEDEVEKLESAVRSLRPRKEKLTEEKREISPRVASITEEEEKVTSIHDAYRSKNQKDEAVLSGLEKDRKEADLSQDKLEELRKRVSSLEGGFEAKKGEIERLKKEYAELMHTNQAYKAIIKEVEEGTELLKKMMDKGT